jgi:hypothetical protein
MVAVSALAPSADAGSRQWSIFEDHNHLVPVTDEARAQALADIAGLGADTLRIQVKWDQVAPSPGARERPAFDETDPAAYPGFGPYDALVKAAADGGFRILVTITGDAPRWATFRARGRNYKPDPGDFGRFAGAVALRYSGLFGDLPAVRWFSIWNEPNYAGFLRPPSQAGHVYRRLVQRALPALRRASNPKVLVGELKPTVGTGTSPVRFMRQWLCLDRRFRALRRGSARHRDCRRFERIEAAGFGYHPYGSLRRPLTRETINLAVIRRLGTLLDRAAAARRLPRGLPIYNTEFGFQTNPPDIFVSTTPERQAVLINESEQLSYRYGRMKSYSQYLLYDDPPRTGRLILKWSGFQAGLRFADGRPKPAQDAYRLPLVVRPDGRRRVSVWGRVRPRGVAWFVQLQRLSGGRYENSGPVVRTDPRGYFALTRARGSYRYLAYDGSGSAFTLLGTSRTAKPAR